MIIKKTILLFILICSVNLYAQNETGFQIARLKYSGGGDWYNDPSAEVNLLNLYKLIQILKLMLSTNLLILLQMKYFLIHFCF